MPFIPFRATVAHTTRLSPNFQRITVTGPDLADMGPAGPIRDLRIKLILPGTNGLPDFPDTANWYAHWTSLDPATRGAMRTYSIRDVRRAAASSTAAPGPTEIDIDFVLHTGPDSAGPAATWAMSAKPGDELFLIAPTRDDASGGGIEFQPGSRSRAVMVGDETALPAIARTLAEWPADLSGKVFLETPTAADRQEVDAPDSVRVHWFDRESGAAHGAHLTHALACLCGIRTAADGSADRSAHGSDATLPGSDAQAASSALVWETPCYSAGEPVEPTHAENPAPVPASATDLNDCYFWIAGESGMVTRMRRMLVKEVGIARRQVSFMGYWKRGVAMAA